MSNTEHEMVRQAHDQVDAAMQAMENYGSGGPPCLLDAAYDHLQHTRGMLVALRQLKELQAIERAATERPVNLQIVAR